MASHSSASSTPADLEDLLSLKEVASKFGVHVDTVRRLVAQRKLKAVRVGRLVRVPRVAVLMYYRRYIR